MSSPRRALIVVDVQQEYFDGPLQIQHPPREESLAHVIRRDRRSPSSTTCPSSWCSTSTPRARRSSLSARRAGRCTPRSRRG